MTSFNIPADVAAHLAKASKVLSKRVERLEFMHSLYKDEDPAPDWDWQVSFDHSEIEALTNDLRQISEFAEWLSRFGAKGGDA